MPVRLQKRFPTDFKIACLVCPECKITVGQNTFLVKNIINFVTAKKCLQQTERKATQKFLI